MASQPTASGIIDLVLAEIAADIVPLTEAATNAVGAVLQTVEFAIQPDGGIVEGCWYGKFYLTANTDFTLLRHWVFLGSGTADLRINIEDVNVVGLWTVSTSKASPAITISGLAGQSVSFQFENITGSPLGIAIQMEGLPA